MLAVATSERLPLWTVLGGSFLGVAVMGWYLLARHPEVRDTGKALGDEVDAPPHPRGRMIYRGRLAPPGVDPHCGRVPWRPSRI